jgi:hypothetical protein
LPSSGGGWRKVILYISRQAAKKNKTIIEPPSTPREPESLTTKDTKVKPE